MKTLMILAVSVAALTAGTARASDYSNTIGDGPWATMTNQAIFQRNVHDAGVLNVSAPVGDSSPWTGMANADLVRANLTACCHGRVPEYTLTTN